MTRLWTFPRNSNGNGQQAPAPPWPPPGGGAELLSLPPTGLVERYESRPVRPIAQLAVRVLLWGAVALGAVGGILSLFRPPAGNDEPVAAPPTDTVDVPAPVAGVAQLVVQEWLTATEDDEARLATLFVEPPSLNGVATSDLSVGRVTAIAGRALQEGYWAVTVEAEVTEPVPVVSEGATDPAAGEDGPAAPAAGTEEQRTSLWYLEVAIVGDLEGGGLAALTTPAVLPGPPEVATGWEASLNEPDQPAPGDPTAEAVDGFLDALLAGAGNPERYLAPGVTATAADPAPFSDVEVANLAVDQLPNGQYRVLAQVWATTPGGARQMLSYELIVVERVDRLEITQFSGAPTMVAGSADPPESEADANAERGQPPTTSDTSEPASDTTVTS